MALIAALRHLRYRPALLAAGIAGAVAGLGGHAILPESSSLLLGWSCGVAVYLAVAAWTADRASLTDIRKRAALLDEGGVVILFVTVGAAMASLGAIVMELARAKGEAHGGAAAALAAITVVLSWMFIHSIFAFHYAHAYYGGDKSSHACLEFPATDKPIYWDFLYFSFVIGMTAQVADVQTKTVSMRKLVLAHGVIAFFFNTAILALGVNLAASLVA
jgi:uncharacterized membrane protein